MSGERSCWLVAVVLALSVGVVSAQAPGEPSSTPTPAADEKDTETPGTTPPPPPVERAEGVPVREDLALPDEAIPMLLEDELPPRAGPILELGPGLLNVGKLPPGKELPTGAVVTPSLWVFGSYRTSINWLDSGDGPDLVENPHRLDLFANLQLTASTRFLVGIQPLHANGKFTTYTFSPESLEGWEDELGLEVSTAFFEGDIGELFPKLDREGTRKWDVGFAVGRQKIEFQDGIMLNDQIDSVGLTWNNIMVPSLKLINVRTTALIGVNDIHRDDNREDDDALLVGWFTELETQRSTIEVDVAYVASDVDRDSSGDGLYLGVSSVQRIGRFNTSLRANASWALDEESAAVSDGLLMFGELSTKPKGSDNIVYCNAFWGIDQYSSAARDPTAGGPLGRTGLMFAAVGLGRFRPALGNRADDAWGIGVGYQLFWDDDRTQLVVEAGGRRSTEDGPDAVAIGARLQRKLGNRLMLQMDGYVSDPDDAERFAGFRTELLVKF